MSRAIESTKRQKWTLTRAILNIIAGIRILQRNSITFTIHCLPVGTTRNVKKKHS